MLIFFTLNVHRTPWLYVGSLKFGQNGQTSKILGKVP